MKYCYQCGKLNSRQSLFCNRCGSSFDVKLCPRLHANSRYAEVCSQCGSHELSTPQPKVSFLWHVLEFLIRIVLGALLVWVSLVILVAAIQELLARSEVQSALVLLGLLLGGLWFLWGLLPLWLRKVIRRLITRKDENHER